MKSANSENTFIKEVQRAADENRIEEAIAMISNRLDAEQSAELYYLRGRMLWRMDRRGEAMSDYGRAIELDPTSPATEALAMAREVMAFYHKDLYNP